MEVVIIGIIATIGKEMSAKTRSSVALSIGVWLGFRSHGLSGVLVCVESLGGCGGIIVVVVIVVINVIGEVGLSLGSYSVLCVMPVSKKWIQLWLGGLMHAGRAWVGCVLSIVVDMVVVVVLSSLQQEEGRESGIANVVHILCMLFKSDVVSKCGGGGAMEIMIVVLLLGLS